MIGDIVSCSECNATAEIRDEFTQLDDRGQEVFLYETQCVNRHFITNYF